MNSRLIFRISAIVEIGTGVALLVAPLLTIDLLFGGELGPVGIAVARVLGVGLLSVGVAAWGGIGVYKMPPHMFHDNDEAHGAAVDYLTPLDFDAMSAHKKELVAYATEGLKAIDGIK